MMRKLIARSLVMMLLVAALPIAPKKEVQAAGAETILAHFTFDNAEEGFRSEGAVATPGKEGVEMKFSDDIAFPAGPGNHCHLTAQRIRDGWRLRKQMEPASYR